MLFDNAVKNMAQANKTASLALSLALCISPIIHAAPLSTDFQSNNDAPVVIKGVVATVSDKNQLLSKLKIQFPNKQIRDEVEVRSNINLPTNWQQVASAIIDSNITDIRQGRVDINGATISLYGKVDNMQQKNAIQTRISSRLTDLYQLDNQLVVSGTNNEQQLIDTTLGNRIVEFESGSANLTPKGLGILDDMSTIIKNIGNKPITIIGHTDNVGNSNANLALSNKRAEAVKQYLIGRGIDSSRLTTSGKGDLDPTASNDTEQGRTRNRRIEFILDE